MATTTSYTVADLPLLQRPPGVAHFELSGGELIPVGNAGGEHEFVKAIVTKIFLKHCLRWGGFEVLAESSFALSSTTSRQPDVAVIAQERFLLLRNLQGPIPFAPDLAVEVVSVSESAASAERKVHEYLAAGTAEVWQIGLGTRRLTVHKRGAAPADFSGSERAASTVLPGFSAAPDDFFAR
jgi:Uma2 family endonuclease